MKSRRKREISDDDEIDVKIPVFWSFELGLSKLSSTLAGKSLSHVICTNRLSKAETASCPFFVSKDPWF
jgi:hypothetical protein